MPSVVPGLSILGCCGNMAVQDGDFRGAAPREDINDFFYGDENTTTLFLGDYTLIRIKGCLDKLYTICDLIYLTFHLFCCLSSSLIQFHIHVYRQRQATRNPVLHVACLYV